VWTAPRFFSLVVYTCKGFDADAAAQFTREAMQADGEMVAHGF
jgi:S-adenosylmethionine decarboxylase